MSTETLADELGIATRRIEPGTFRMGGDGPHAERPVHEVTISESFELAETPVSNAQYEAFDPAHRDRRGVRGFSTGDDEAVVAVSWDDAAAFCEWLARETGEPYRLPTEAEWEYACRAGTATAFHTGDDLPAPFHRHQEDDWHPEPVDLTVGETPPNDWGLRDVHGLVEEWCHDWFGPYPGEPVTDPVGHAAGPMKVTRGGSHNTAVSELRSASRMGTLPEDRHWLIGFRPALGALPNAEPLPAPDPERWADEVGGNDADWEPPSGPYFAEPIPFVRDPPDPASVPMYDHNHCPSVAYCDNGDLLACWFSTESEHGRELTILASRLRAGGDEWGLPAEFFDAPRRNMTGSALFNDGNGTLHHFNGLGAASEWATLALVLRTSEDDGATWSRPRLIDPEHRYRHQVVSGTIKTDDGNLLQPCDAVHWGQGGTAIHVSRDGGETWTDPGRDQPVPRFEAGETGGWIAGIHAGVVELSDGRLLAMGRGDEIDGRMPRSVSTDVGESWTYGPSAFPPVSWGQRIVLTRLREGPILLASFTDPSDDLDDPSGMDLRAPDGEERRCYGLFAAVSFDDGETWPARRLVSGGDPARELDGRAGTGPFTMDRTHAEPKGYLAGTQTPDGVVHLLSSGLHYRFDLAWLTEGVEAGR